MRFDQFIRPSMTVRDVTQRFPQTGVVFAGYRFRDACADCSLEVAARRQGLDPAELVEALNRVVFRQPEEDS